MKPGVQVRRSRDGATAEKCDRCANVVEADRGATRAAHDLDTARAEASTLRARVAELETHIVTLREAQTRNVEGVVRERDEARRDFAACAHAIGVEHVQDCGPSAPGPVEAVVGHIEEAARHAGEAVGLRARVAELEGALSEQAASHDDPVWSRLDALAKDADGVWSKLRLQADRAGWDRAMAAAVRAVWPGATLAIPYAPPVESSQGSAPAPDALHDRLKAENTIMLTIHWQTNLDEAQPYVRRMHWTTGPVPSIGHEILFTVERQERRYFTLRVCAVTWEPDGETVVVELHMPTSWNTRSINDWTEHMRRLEGRV